MPKISTYITNLTPERAEQMKAGGRYEVVFDHLDGDHTDYDVYFRLVEPSPAQKITVGGLGGAEPVMELPVLREDVVISYRRGDRQPEYRTKTGRLLTDEQVSYLAEQERREFPVRTLGTGSGIVTTGYPAAELFMARASDLLAAIIGMLKISPMVLGIPSGDDALHARLYWHLTGQEPVYEEDK